MASPTSGNSLPPSLTSTLSSLSWASSLSTPENKAEDPLSLFFETSGYSPPEKADLVPLGAVVVTANDYLSRIEKKWDQLNTLGQVKLAFLLLRKQDELLYEYSLSTGACVLGEDAIKKTADLLWKVCQDERDPRFSKVEAYVQNGGDRIWGESNAFYSLDGLFNKFPAFQLASDQSKVATLFHNPSKDNHLIEPAIRLQDDQSAICYVVSVAAAIYYSQQIKEGGGTQNDETKRRFTLNVNRYMRNYFSNEEIFKDIFYGGCSWPREIIQRLLQPYNVGKEVSFRVSFEPFEEGEANAYDIFRVVKKNLKKYGALLIENVPVFQDLLDDNGMLEFSGDWNGIEGKLLHLPRHVFLVVGARLAGDPSNLCSLELLLQNSWQTKPFLVFGFDLLKTMGITDFIVVNDNLEFSCPGNCSMDGELSNNLWMSGSPRGQHNQSVSFSRSDSNFYTPMSSILERDAGARRPLTDPYYWIEVKRTGEKNDAGRRLPESKTNARRNTGTWYW